MPFFIFNKPSLSKTVKAMQLLTAILLCSLIFTGCAVSRSVSDQEYGTETHNTLFSLNEDAEEIITFSEISAQSAILIDADSGKIYGAKNPDEKMSMASTTKIMTALVAIENCDVSKTVQVSPLAVGVEGSSIYLYEGERLTLKDLLYAMLLESANDAAAAIAIEVGGSIDCFADMMNEKATELGLKNTHFANPHGLDNENHYTTARELAIIAAAAMKNDIFREIVSTYKKTIPLNNTEGVRLLINHNRLLKSYEGAVGIKTGYTKRSGRCLVSAAERDGLSLICVTLNAPDDWQDHKAMLDSGFEKYESRLLCGDGKLRHTLPIVGGDSDYVVLTNKGDLRITLPRNTYEIKCEFEVFDFEYAPINKGDICGKAVYLIGEEKIAEAPLYAEYDVPRTLYRKSFWESLASLFGK